ncbi:MAG: hypothetical protein QW758_01660 [Candidatus Aenigmatarchaeota archaeon]
MRKFFLLFLLVLFLLFSHLAISINVSLVNLSLNEINLSYDRIKNGTETLGSFSYKDNSLKNSNAFLLFCETNSSFLNNFIDFLYSSESGNITISLLSLLPMIYNITNENCSVVDIDISAFKALYPSIPFVAIYREFFNESKNETEIERIFLKKMENSMLLGNYSLGVDIDDILKETYLTVEKIFDENNETIEARAKHLIMSIVDNNVSIKEAIASPYERVTFKYMFKANETVFVNGIPSLRVRAIEPCSIVNETGFYYVINRSEWNTNDTCLIVENTKNIVIDFANKTIDGDKNESGSFREDVCGVIIRNVENISLKDVRVQEFYRGICIINSSNIKIFGTSSQENIDGVYSENSTFKIHNIKIVNENSEVIVKNNSIATLSSIFFKNATLSGEYSGVLIKSIFIPPPDPANLYNISQWINVSRIEDFSYIKNITFHFEFPNPNKVIPKEIHRIDGILENNTWSNITREKLNNTFVDMDKKIIFSLTNITNFSIFAPYGEKVNITEPEPVPEPTPVPQPTPMPSEVPGREEVAKPPKINLTLINKSITLQQGEIGEIYFNITNFGESNVRGIRVLPFVRRGWNNSFVDIDLLKVNETKTDSFLISIYENEIPGTYYIPVYAILKANNASLDMEILEVIVIPRKRIAKLSILEFTPFLSLPEHSKVSIAMLVKNTGDFNLTNIRLVIKNGDKCIEGIEGNYSLNVNEEASLIFSLYTKGAKNTCESVFVLESDQGVVALYPVIIEIKEYLAGRGLFYLIRITPLILIIWTILLIKRFRKRFKE